MGWGTYWGTGWGNTSFEDVIAAGNIQNISILFTAIGTLFVQIREDDLGPNPIIPPKSFFTPTTIIPNINTISLIPTAIHEDNNILITPKLIIPNNNALLTPATIHQDNDILLTPKLVISKKKLN